jgi:hypothetical protein
MRGPEGKGIAASPFTTGRDLSRTKWFKGSKQFAPQALLIGISERNDKTSRSAASYSSSLLAPLIRRGKQLGRPAHALDGLGADRYLLATIGTWAEPLTDEQCFRICAIGTLRLGRRPPPQR